MLELMRQQRQLITENREIDEWLSNIEDPEQAAKLIYKQKQNQQKLGEITESLWEDV